MPVLTATYRPEAPAVVVRTHDGDTLDMDLGR